MANPTISEIKIDNTTYNICDYDTRSKISAFSAHSRSYSSSIDISGKSQGQIDWKPLPSSYSNYIYVGYYGYSLGGSSYNIYLVALTENNMIIYNNSSNTNSIGPGCYAYQLYFRDNFS